MSGFGMKKSLDIDNGELDGLRPQECFVLGYELALIDSDLEQGRAISKPVHSANRERIEKSCRESGRQYRLTWPHDDRSEMYMQLDVGGEA